MATAVTAALSARVSRREEQTRGRLETKRRWGEWMRLASGCLWARLEGARGPPGRQPGDAGDGMVATHLCVPQPGEDDRGAAGLGRGRVSWAGVAQVSGLLSFSDFLFCFSFCYLFWLAKINT